MRGLSIVTPLVFLGLTGCYTTYGAATSDIQLDSNTVRVTARGNAYTSGDRVDIYLLYRCAEVTIEHGFDYFVIVDDASQAVPYNLESSSSTYSTPYERLSPYGGSHTETNTTVMIKHRHTAIIKMFNGKKPQDLPNAYDAKELESYLAPRINQ